MKREFFTVIIYFLNGKVANKLRAVSDCVFCRGNGQLIRADYACGGSPKCSLCLVADLRLGLFKLLPVIYLKAGDAVGSSSLQKLMQSVCFFVRKSDNKRADIFERNI